MRLEFIDPNEQGILTNVQHGLFGFCFQALTPGGKATLKSSMLPEYLSKLYGSPNANQNVLDTYFPEYFACIGYPQKYLVTQDNKGKIAAMPYRGNRKRSLDIHESYEYDGNAWRPMGEVVSSASSLTERLLEIVSPVSTIELELELDRIGARRFRGTLLMEQVCRRHGLDVELFADEMSQAKDVLMQRVKQQRSSYFFS